MSDNDNEVSHHQILSTIDQKLARLSSNNTNYNFISRIDNILRKKSEAAYEPEMVSIGPYHRGKKKLQKMEKFKLEYLQGILNAQNESSPRRYIDSLLQDEKLARSYYAEEVSLTREEFVEMMLLDGCFIVEFFRKYAKKNDVDQDPIIKTGWIFEIIRRDLLLFENQIPYFILRKLFDMTQNSPTAAADDDREQETNLFSLAVICLNHAINPVPSPVKKQVENIFHLVNLMYEVWCQMDLDKLDGTAEDARNHIMNVSDSDDMMLLKSVTELKQDGIEFVKAEQSKSFMDIKFEDGKIKIPPLVIHEGTISILRNLIVYEHVRFDFKFSPKAVTDYATFMDFLINKPEDAQDLRMKRIIQNRLGNDKEVSDMFNSIGTNNAYFSPQNFTYFNLFKNVNKHCKDRRNKWFHDLMITHFKNPWSITSLVAAAILLILTLIQTVLSFSEYF